VEKILRVVFLDIENPGPVSKLYEQYSVCIIHLINIAVMIISHLFFLKATGKAQQSIS
jgi:hypothetical protein